MKLIRPSARIIQTSFNPLALIEEAGRTCYKSEDKITEDSHQGFTAMILKRGHESVIEHASATVRFICDRGVSHEIVRHRLASYSQESTRYCDYEGELQFIIPCWTTIIPGIRNDLVGEMGGLEAVWIGAMLEAEASYHCLRDRGWKPEEARSVLPNSLKTEIVMTANLREWRHFFKLRTSKAAHPQMREVATPLLENFKLMIPVIFDDIEGSV